MSAEHRSHRSSGRPGGGGRRRPVPPPTAAQVALARTVAARHEIDLPEGVTGDGAWMRAFLDVFAYDPETEEGVFRRVRNLIQWAREGRTPAEMAHKLGLPAERVVFALGVLRDSGHDLAEVAEEVLEDPEEICWRCLEAAAEDAA